MPRGVNYSYLLVIANLHLHSNHSFSGLHLLYGMMGVSLIKGSASSAESQINITNFVCFRLGSRYCSVVAHKMNALILEEGEKSGKREKRPKKLRRG